MTDLEWSPVTVRLGDLSHWAENPVTLSKAQAKKLLKSTEKLGRMQTLAIGPQNGDGKHPLYDGHQRVNVWGAAFGMELQVNALQSSRPLTDEERHQVPIMLRTAAGSLDWDALAGWDANSLMEWGFDSDMLDGWKCDIAALGNLIESETPEPQDAEPQIDRAEELQEKWQVKMGDLWHIGGHRLLCGDSTKREDVERVMQGERAGAVVTDSPYGIEREGIENDDPEGLRALFDGVLTNMPIENAVVINFQSPRLFPVWLDAVRAAGHKFERVLWMYMPVKFPSFAWRGWYLRSDCISVSSIGKPKYLEIKPYQHDTYIYEHENELSNGWHSSVKPLVVVQDLVSRIDGDVYEPFVGSGTTIVACQNLGRKCRAIEISPAYCAVTLERMSTAFPALTIERI